jgi:membrane associated rhomboid family serine protease
MAVCYRHPNRETGVSCSNCGRPICTDCMTPTPVGMRCPECARQRTRVRTARSFQRSGDPIATRALIALNAAVFFAQTATGSSLGGALAGKVSEKGWLDGPNVHLGHQYWRLLSSGFLHAGLLHIALNMFFLFFIGRILEPGIGAVNFVAVYVTSLLAGSFGALLFQPDIPTVGASGACFGLLGALIVVAYDRGIPIWQSGLGPTLLINAVFTLTIRGISIGGHLGGLIGGIICGYLVVQLGERRRRRPLALAGCAAVAVVSVVGAIAVAGSAGLTPNGLRI